MLHTLSSVCEGNDLVFLQREIGRIEARLGTRFTDTARVALLIHLAIAIGRIQTGNKITMDPERLDLLKKSECFQVACDLAREVEARFSVRLPDAEKGYITLHLLGAKRSLQDGFANKQDEAFLQDLSLKMAEAAEKALGKRIVDRELVTGLTTHLVAAYYRVRYGLPTRNPLLEEIKTVYPDVYEAAEESGRVFAALTGIPLPEEEVAYVAMHVGAAVERNRGKDIRKKRVAVVCASGVGTANLLSAQIESHFAQVEVVGTYSVLDLKSKLPMDLDAVISTVPIELDNVPCAVVYPILRLKDMRLIDSLLDIIPSGPHEANEITDSSLSVLKLTKSTIRFDVSCSDWKEAVRLAGQVLLDNGFCQKSYVEAMVRQIEAYGSYVVFKGGLALPHAKPSDGAIKPGMSLLKLRKPVVFPGMDQEPVTTVIALSLTEKLGPRELKVLKDIVFGDLAVRMAQAKDLKELMTHIGHLVVPSVQACV